jgi:hypothetical protein
MHEKEGEKRTWETSNPLSRWLGVSVNLFRYCIHRRCGYHVSTGNTAGMNEMSWGCSGSILTMTRAPPKSLSDSVMVQNMKSRWRKT